MCDVADVAQMGLRGVAQNVGLPPFSSGITRLFAHNG